MKKSKRVTSSIALRYNELANERNYLDISYHNGRVTFDEYMEQVSIFKTSYFILNYKLSH